MSFFGGGTDMENFFRENGGAVLSTTFDKYCYLIADFFGGISMRLKTGQKCAFGFGAFGKDIVYMLISSYLLYYYNVVLVVSIILVYTSLNICGNLVLYFFRFDVGNEGAYSIFAAVAFAAQVLVMMVIPLLRKRFSKSQLFISGFIIQIAGFAVILIMAFAKLYTPQSWYILCLPGILIYLGYGMLNVIIHSYMLQILFVSYLILGGAFRFLLIFLLIL